ncbi:MAG: DUF433 domain-containing protein [Halobacteriales archaeon]|nr:DUF433 domain-containing protein [Halobacteriales archaeon]
MEQKIDRIVHDDDVLGGEPRIDGTRLGVLFIKECVEDRGLEPRSVADRYDLDIADVYRALAYYHDNPAEMREIEKERRETVEEHRGLTTDPSVVG